MKITTIVFDLDGTLLDTLQDLAVSVNFALKTHGLPPRTLMEVRARLGNGIRFLVDNSVPEGTPVALTDIVFATFKTHYMAHCRDLTAPYEGIAEMLVALKERGYKMAIVSNKLHEAVQELHEQFFATTIDVAIGESPTVRRKPAPDGVWRALERMGSMCQESVYVGDSEVDMATAQASGLTCLTVLWGFRDEDFLRQRGAQVCLPTPADLVAFLDGYNA